MRNKQSWKPPPSSPREPDLTLADPFPVLRNSMSTSDAAAAAAAASLKPRPVVSKSQAREIAQREFGLQVASDEDLRTVDSYEDVNFCVKGKREGGQDCKEETYYILKFHNSFDSAPDGGLATLKAQEEVLAMVTRATVPKQFCPGKHVDVGGQSCYVRVLSFIPGQLLANEPSPQPANLLKEFGRCLGALDDELRNFSHPGSQRYLIWDLRNALKTVQEFRGAVRSQDDIALIDQAIRVISEQVMAVAKELRVSTIHGDANDHNVIVDAHGRSQAVGLIDFGDLVESWVAAEAAIAMAYIMVAEPVSDRKLAQARHFLDGYQELMALESSELGALYGLIVARLATSVCISATDSVNNPENAEYTLVHAKGAWDTLRYLLCDLEPAEGPRLFIDNTASA